MRRYITATMIAEEPNSPLFRPAWGLPPSLTDTMKVPRIEMMMPAPAMIRGRVMKTGSYTPATRMPAPSTMEPRMEPT